MTKESDFLKSVEIVEIANKIYDGKISQGRFKATQKKLRQLEESTTYMTEDALKKLNQLEDDGFFSF